MNKKENNTIKLTLGGDSHAEQAERPSDRCKQILYKPIRKLKGCILNIRHHPESLRVADEAAVSLITLAAHTFGKLQTNHKDDDCDPQTSSLDFYEL